MEIKRNNDDSSDHSLKPNFEGVTQQRSGSNISIINLDSTKIVSQDMQQLLDIREMVCDRMHKAMSPISAVSGYLELMKMLLEQDSNTELLERYRSKIEEGVNEIGDIVEDLHETLAKKEDSVEDSSADLNNHLTEPNRYAS